MIKNIPVENDIAERGIKLINDYDKKITKDKIQKLYILQVVYVYRKIYRI